MARQEKAGIRKRSYAICSLLVAAVLVFNLETAEAHVRTYAWNQEYQTLPQGGFELESHTTFKVPKWEESNKNSIEYQGELEYGVTDHWTVAHYERWETENQAGAEKDATAYSGFKFETKYRIGERGKYWVDPLLYLELSHDPREEEVPLEIEGKIILSKNIDKFNATYNQILESGTGRHGRTEHEFTVGLNHEILPDFRLGMEIKGQYWNPDGNRNEFALGPTLAYESKYFWVATGILFGANHAADDFQARILVGVPF